jgi:hypothetical protein
MHATITATGLPKDIRVKVKSKSHLHFQATIPDLHVWQKESGIPRARLGVNSLQLSLSGYLKMP